ncbi:MAG: hypothetical protein RDV48_00050 [Candidatus Eremiobacteraeota bacterium]|nr:hypothetical protein [Candidatus Eremiobacteraeota bacterium]
MAKKPKGKKQQRASRWAFIESPAVLWFCAVILVLAVVPWYPTLQGDYDMWWHLRYGQHFVTQGTFQIDHSAYSWTPAPRPWVCGSWLGSSLFYFIYVFWGIMGLMAAKWLVYLAMFLLLLAIVRLSGRRLDLACIMAFVLIAAAYKLNGTYIRPERFSNLLFVATAFLYFAGRLTGRSLFWLFPLVILLWTNVHGGFIVGLLFITLALAGEALDFFARKKGDAGRLRGLALSVLASYAVTLINPEGIRYHFDLFQSLSGTGTYEPVEGFTIKEYRSLWRYIFTGSDLANPLIRLTPISMVIMGALHGAAALMAYRQKKYLDLSLTLMNAVFFVFGLQVARAVVYYPFVWFFSTVCLLSESKVSIQGFMPWALAIFLCFAAFMGYDTLTSALHTDWQGSPGHDFVPEEEARFISTWGLPAPLYNDYLSGGYLLWALYPSYKVFLDPRGAPYDLQFFGEAERFASNPSAGALEALQRKYPFRTALVHRTKQKVLLAFLQSPQWRPLYFHKNAIVLVRKEDFDALPPGAKNVDLSPERYRDEKNPQVLDWAFGMCGNPSDGAKIYRYYCRNVSDLYRHKKTIVRMMEENLRNRGYTP